MADVQIAIRLWGESRHHRTAMFAGDSIDIDYLTDKICRRRRGVGVFVDRFVTHLLCLLSAVLR
jgi:hypothetical protein